MIRTETGMADVEQQHMMRLYRQMAATMQTLADVQQLEKQNDDKVDPIDDAKILQPTPEETGAIPKKSANKKVYNPFDDDDDDVIRRKDYVS